MTIAEMFIEKGKLAGIDLGIAKGKLEGIQAVAIKLLEIGTSSQLVAQVTGLSLKEIEKLLTTSGC